LSIYFFPTPQIHKLIELALEEDLGGGDVTSESVFSGKNMALGEIISKENMTICGLPLIPIIINKIDPSIKIEFLKKDGDEIKSGEKIVILSGDIIPLLAIERTILNFIQHLSGIATRVREVILDKPPEITIVDTRKTLPGWRYLQKYAVKTGGGNNHRMDLSGGILIKDNHIDVAGGIENAISAVRKNSPHPLKIEIEVRNFNEAKEAVENGANILLLDNMTPEQMKNIVDKFKGKVLFEASGGVTPQKLNEIYKTGINLISMGMLTHTVKASDISMKTKISLEKS
jgi:nicotinate-nucleotide pyrophosphorylase (carboxylating)